MRDRDLETLLRMSGELDEFERGCGRIGRPRRERAASPVIIRLRRLTMFAAAAAVAWVALRFNVTERPQPRDHGTAGTGTIATPAITVKLCSTTPAVALPERAASYRVQPTVGEDCSLVALMRTWSAECGCLLWEVHEFENGNTVTRADRGEAIDLIGSEGAEVVVLAMSRDATQLSNAKDTAELLSCLDSNTRDSSLSPDARRSADIVAACLPREVTIVSHRLGEPR
ncbi:MAG: hypothetical protein ACKVS9_11485 [Phycisphaerae bacterium]